MRLVMQALWRPMVVRVATRVLVLEMPLGRGEVILLVRQRRPLGRLVRMVTQVQGMGPPGMELPLLCNLLVVLVLLVPLLVLLLVMVVPRGEPVLDRPVGIR